MTSPHIALLCATQRGYQVLQRVHAVLPDCELTVFSFLESGNEPRYLDDIRQFASSIGARFIQTKAVHKQDEFWQSAGVDLMLAVNWRYMIPCEIYERPRLGTYIMHDSLLPAYRGFSPTVWAMVNGERQTGVTLFEIADDVDSGDIVDQQAVDIGSDDTIADVFGRVTAAYLTVIQRSLPRLLDQTATKRPQDHTQATFTCKRLPADNRIDWTWTTERIYNLIRAVTKPYPGAFTDLNGQKLIVWEAKPIDPPRRYVGRVPGRVVEQRPGVGAVVLTGDGMLLVTRVQLEGEPEQSAHKVLNRLSHTLGR